MNEHVALDKHSCAACGSAAEWHAARQALVCPYCGTEAPAALDGTSGRVVENDLVRALRELPDEQRGWQADRRSVRCRSCNAVSVFDAGRVGQSCEFCGSPALVDYEEIRAPIRPQGLLPFRVDEGRVRDTIRGWYAKKWLAPGKLRKRALLDSVVGVYLPYWTFDARADCPWTAEAGTFYYVDETYRDAQGRTRTRRQRRVRWRPAAGTVQHFFDDQPVPGTRGVELSLLRRIEPFPFAELVPYDTAYLSGFVVEHYQVVLLDAVKESREAMERALHGLCAAQVPGDTQRNLRIAPSFSGQTFKHVLVPVWLLRYDFGGKSFRVLVNGHTGKVAGHYPKSLWKIALVVLAALAAVLTLIALN